MSVWQTIGSAPEDGTHVIVYDHASDHIGEAYRGYEETDDDEVMWFWANLSLDDEDSIVAEPTHWMPLPAPPQADPAVDPHADNTGKPPTRERENH